MLPHTDAMCLLDALVSWDESGIHCTAISHRDLDNPLRLDGRLAAVHTIEYASQACALHGALCAAEWNTTPARLLLAATNQVELAPVDLSMLPTPMEIMAWREFGGADGAIYRFTVSSGGQQVAGGRLTVMVTGRCEP
jgi:predicted hotdog family 3-hydroxylacyl-ACP dehydratase